MISRAKFKYLIVTSVVISLVIPLIIWELIFSENINIENFFIIYIIGFLIMVLNTQVWWIVIKREKIKEDEKDTKNN